MSLPRPNPAPTRPEPQAGTRVAGPIANDGEALMLEKAAFLLELRSRLRTRHGRR